MLHIKPAFRFCFHDNTSHLRASKCLAFQNTRLAKQTEHIKILLNPAKIQWTSSTKKV